MSIRSPDPEYPQPRPRMAVAFAGMRAALGYRVALGLLASTRMLVVAAVALVLTAAGYLAKSFLGIDVLPGPSPLHDLLYPLITG